MHVHRWFGCCFLALLLWSLSTSLCPAYGAPPAKPKPPAFDAGGWRAFGVHVGGAIGLATMGGVMHGVLSTAPPTPAGNPLANEGYGVGGAFLGFLAGGGAMALSAWGISGVARQLRWSSHAGWLWTGGFLGAWNGFLLMGTLAPWLRQLPNAPAQIFAFAGVLSLGAVAGAVGYDAMFRQKRSLQAPTVGHWLGFLGGLVPMMVGLVAIQSTGRSATSDESTLLMSLSFVGSSVLGTLLGYAIAPPRPQADSRAPRTPGPKAQATTALLKTEL